MTETPIERKKLFKEMSSFQRQSLIRQKMKEKGLIEGSGVREKNQASYDKKEMIDLIYLTKCFPMNNS